MSTRPDAFWKAVALDFPRSPKPAGLMAEFGAWGPYGWLVLIFEAKRAEYAQLDKAKRRPGVVSLAWATFTHTAGCPSVEAAKTLLTRLQELGEATIEDHGYQFTATLTDWTRWEAEPVNPITAAAKRKQRS